MIALVAQTINGCVSGVLWVLKTAALVGQIIVGVFAGFLSGANTVWTFLGDVYEDNRNLFTLELPSMVLDVPCAVLGHFCDAAETLTSALASVYSTIVYSISASVQFLLSNFTPCALWVKKAFIIIGDSLWLIITLIPIQLPVLLGTICGWIIHICLTVVVAAAVTMYSSLLRLTNFLTDVPLQSMLGIVSTVIFVRLIIEFQIVSNLARIYRMSVRWLRIYYYSFFTDENSRLIAQIVRDARPRYQNIGVQEPDSRDSLCVICQERQKCVLILPCRHICLCCECCDRLYRYQRTCPICRTFISHSATVYL